MFTSEQSLTELPLRGAHTRAGLLENTLLENALLENALLENTTKKPKATSALVASSFISHLSSVNKLAASLCPPPPSAPPRCYLQQVGSRFPYIHDLPTAAHRGLLLPGNLNEPIIPVGTGEEALAWTGQRPPPIPPYYCVYSRRHVVDAHTWGILG